MIGLENLTVGYSTRVVVRDINVEVNRGEIVTLIGPNGCGKSTILRTLSGLIPPKSGKIYLEGQRLENINRADLARLRAVMLTDTRIRERMSVREVTAFGRFPYTGFFGKLSDEDERIIDDALNQTGCEDLKDRDFNTLSDGQKQRVYLARAIAQAPRLMLLDEPTTFLDVKYKLEFLTLLKSLAKTRNITIIMSLHELDMVAQISDRIIAIKDCQVDKIASPEEIFQSGYINSLYSINMGCFDEKTMRGLISNGS